MSETQKTGKEQINSVGFLPFFVVRILVFVWVWFFGFWGSKEDCVVVGGWLVIVVVC